MARSIGRPRNTGLDDEPLIRAIEASLADGTQTSERAAIIGVVGPGESDVRRLQRKVSRRRLARSGDLACIPDLGMAFAPPRPTNGFVVVDLGEMDGRRVSLAQCVHLQRPHLMKMVDGRLDIPSRDIPPHPVFLALDRLPANLWWEQDGYRSLCVLVGLDPDLERPFLHPAFTAYQAEGEMENPLRRRRSAFAPRGRGLDGGRLDRLATELHKAGEWPDGGLSPEVAAAERDIDWEGDDVRADLDPIPMPWSSPTHVPGIAVMVGTCMEGGLYSGFDPFHLCVVPEAPSHALAAREAIRNLELNGLGMAVPASISACLSQAEADRLAHGGSFPDAEREQWAILALAASLAYGGYVRRRTRHVEPQPPSSCGFSGLAFPAGWRRDLGTVEWHYPPGQQRRASGIIYLSGGELHIHPRGPGTAFVTSSSLGIRHEGRTLRFSCAFRLPHPKAPSAIPLLGSAMADFECSHVDDLSPVHPELAMGLIATSLMPATHIIRDHSDVALEFDRFRHPEGRLGIREAFAAGQARGMARNAAAMARRIARLVRLDP